MLFYSYIYAYDASFCNFEPKNFSRENRDFRAEKLKNFVSPIQILICAYTFPELDLRIRRLILQFRAEKFYPRKPRFPSRKVEKFCVSDSNFNMRLCVSRARFTHTMPHFAISSRKIFPEKTEISKRKS